ncbi:MAG: hypothetical protein ACK4MM_00710 [Fervidobacterium sp.]
MTSIQDYLFIVLLALGIGLIGFLLIANTSVEDVQWIIANGVKIQSIPKDAVIVYQARNFDSRVRELKEKDKLIAFRGQAISGGVDTVRARDKAKMDAYKELSEYLNTRIQTFAQLVEGQIQNVSTQGDKENIKSAAVNAYKRVTNILSEAQVSGTYIYAIWEEYVGGLVYTNVLLIFDPEGALEALRQVILADQELSKQIEELGKSGVDFFKALNAVIEEAKK